MALTRLIFSLPNMSLITLALWNEEPKAMRAASRVKVLLASSPQLQYDSTGTHTQPSTAHFRSLDVCFLLSAASAAAPTLLHASAKIAEG